MSLSIGNDIVDLADASRQRHPRFAARVLSAQEQIAIGTDPHQLWQAWAAKEAAYKALKRVEPTLVFAPRSFEFDAAREVVRHGGVEIPCRSKISEDFVHAVCVYSSTIYSATAVAAGLLDEVFSAAKVMQLDADEGLSPSNAVRRLAQECAAHMLGISQGRIELSEPYDGGGATRNSVPRAPYVIVDGVPTQHLLSLSHDGRFVACVFRKAS